MIAWAAAVLAVIVGLVLKALITEEIKGWLAVLPHCILRLAATFLDPNQRSTIYQDEWLPELAYILQCAEGRPITRLIRSTTFAAGLLISSHRVARRLTRTAQHASITPETVHGSARIAGSGELRTGPTPPIFIAYSIADEDHISGLIGF